MSGVRRAAATGVLHQSGVALVIALTTLACAADRPEQMPAPDSAVSTDTSSAAADAVLALDCDTLASTLLRTGATRNALAEAYGAPDSVEVTTEPNRHMPGATDSLFVVHYPGLAVTLRTPPSARDLVSAVTVTDNRYFAYPSIGIGARASALVGALGEPDERTTAGGTTSLIYACGEEVEQPVTFHLRDGVVMRIEASYYVD